MSNLRELLKEAREFVYARKRDDDLRARIDAALAKPDPLEQLSDTHVLHANLIRGQPARLTREQFLHLSGFGDELADLRAERG